jgi:hypothetical protein
MTHESENKPEAGRHPVVVVIDVESGQRAEVSADWRDQLDDVFHRAYEQLGRQWNDQDRLVSNGIRWPLTRRPGSTLGQFYATGYSRDLTWLLSPAARDAR